MPDPRDFPDSLPGGQLYRDALAAWERVALALVARVEVQAVPKEAGLKIGDVLLGEGRAFRPIPPAVDVKGKL